MKKLFTLVLVLCMIFALCACGSTAGSSTGAAESSGTTDAEPAAAAETPADEKPFTVGFSIASLDYPYYVTMQEALEAACQEKGWNYICVDSNNDAEKALNDCADMILKDIDALVITSWFGETLQDVFDSCEEKNIPVFLIDTGTVDREANYVTEIGTDSFLAGYYGGLWTAQYFLENEEKSVINFVAFYNQTEMSGLRVDGFVAGLEEGGLTVNVLNKYIDSTREGYMANCEDALITYSDIDLIYGASALAGLGAYDACEAANRTEIKIVGFDAEQEEIDKIDAGTNYIASIMQLPAAMAQATIDIIDDLVNNGVVPEKKMASDSGVYCIEGAISSASFAD